MKSALQVLREARELISVRGRWVKGFAAKNSKGQRCPVMDPDAQCFCLNGALLRVGEGKQVRGTRPAVLNAARSLGMFPHGSLNYINDSNDHETVLEVLDLAISELAGDGE